MNEILMPRGSRPHHVLVNTPSRFYHEDQKQAGERELTPYGLGSVATDAQERLGEGEVGLLDAEYFGLSPELIAQDVGEATGGEGTVGLNVLTPTFPISIIVGKAILREYPRIKLLYGGPHATLDPLSILRHVPEAVVVQGEGEGVFARLAEGEHPQSMDGTVYVDQDREVRHGGSGLPSTVKDLDILPWIDRRFFINEPYEKYGLKTMTFLSSRGCRGGCGFCITPAMYEILKRNEGHKKVRFRDIQDVVAEVAFNREKYQLGMAQIIDDDVMPNARRVREFIDAWKGFGLAGKMEFVALLRPDKIYDYYEQGLLQELYNVGLRKLSIGIETGHDRGRVMVSGLNGRIDSKYDPANLRKAIIATNAVGIETKGFAMIGLPGETREEIAETVRFLYELRQLGLDRLAMFVLKVYPATPLYNTAQNLGFSDEQLGHYGSTSVGKMIADGLDPKAASRDIYTQSVQLSELSPLELEEICQRVMDEFSMGEVNSLV